MIPIASPSDMSPALPSFSLSEQPSLSLSNTPSMVLSAAPSLPTQEDHYFDEYYSGEDLTVMNSDTQVLYYNQMLSAVANNETDESVATCQVLN